MTTYVAVYERADDGAWGAYLPDLPGVAALGATQEEVASGLREALAAYAEEMRVMGRTMPPAVATTETVAA